VDEKEFVHMPKDSHSLCRDLHEHELNLCKKIEREFNFIMSCGRKHVCELSFSSRNMCGTSSYVVHDDMQSIRIFS